MDENNLSPSFKIPPPGSSIPDSKKQKKSASNLVLFLSILVLAIGIGIGLYTLNAPFSFLSKAATDFFTRCGPPGHCDDYGWQDGKGYMSVPTNCYVALYKCNITKWDQVLQVGCQRNLSDPSKNTAFYAEIHKLTDSNPNPQIWDKVVAGTDGNGHIKPFFPPEQCVIWQMDVGPACNFSFHSQGNRRTAVCQAPTNTPVPTKTPTPTSTPRPTGTVSPTRTPTPTPSNCPKPKNVNNLKIICPICSQGQ